RAAGLAAEEAPGSRLDAVHHRADDELGCQHAHDPPDGKAAAAPPWPARVGHEPVRERPQREAGLEYLDRCVATVAVNVVLRARTVQQVPAPPTARLEVVVRVSVAVSRIDAAEDKVARGDPLGRHDAFRQSIGERAEEKANELRLCLRVA